MKIMWQENRWVIRNGDGVFATSLQDSICPQIDTQGKWWILKKGPNDIRSSYDIDTNFGVRCWKEGDKTKKFSEIDSFFETINPFIESKKQWWINPGYLDQTMRQPEDGLEAKLIFQ